MMANTFKALSTVTVGSGGASTISFTSIPASYTDLCIILSCRSTASAAWVDGNLSLNSSSSNFSWTSMYSTGASAVSGNENNNTSLGQIVGNTSTANVFSNIKVYILQYLRDSAKPIHIDYGSENNATTAYRGQVSTVWDNTAAVNSVSFTLSSGNFAQYSTATLYGVFNSDTSDPPSTPTIGTAVGINAAAAVPFTPVSSAAYYTAISTPGSFTSSGVKSPLLVTGLSNGTSYTFKVSAANPNGTSALSAASNSATPSAGTAYDVLLGTSSSPYINAYVFQNGWGSKYANPATLPTNTAAAVSFAPNKTALIIAEDGSSPYVSAYAWSSGFGSKYSNPATAPAGRRLGADFRGGSVAVGFGGDSPSPWVDAYPWNPGFGSKYSNPATLGTGGFSVRWSPDGTVFSSTNNSASPYLAAWAWSGGFGSKYSNPASAPANATYGQNWTPSSNAVVYSVGGTPFFAAYAWSSGYGSKYSNPATLPSGLPGRVGGFNPSGTVLVTANSYGSYIDAYAWSSGFGTKYANPSVSASSSGENAMFTPDGNNIIQSGQGSVPVAAYAWSSGFAVKYSDPTTPAVGVGYGLDVK
jgi:hypothetical protein